LQHQPVDRRLAQPELRERRQYHGLARGGRGELEGSGADEVLTDLGAVLVQRRLGDDPAADVGQVVEHLPVGLLEDQDHRVGAGRGQRRDVVAEAAQGSGGALGQRRVVGLELPPEARQDVGGGERAAVVEGDALPELERVGELVVGDRPALGEVRLRGVGLEGDERQAAADAVHRHPVAQGGVEGRVVDRAGAVDGEGQGAAGPGRVGLVVGGHAAGAEKAGHADAGAHTEEAGSPQHGATGDGAVS
jgi:hypothetical protein